MEMSAINKERFRVAWPLWPLREIRNCLYRLRDRSSLDNLYEARERSEFDGTSTLLARCTEKTIWLEKISIGNAEIVRQNLYLLQVGKDGEGQ